LDLLSLVIIVSRRVSMSIIPNYSAAIAAKAVESAGAEDKVDKPDQAAARAEQNDI
jgi:hypothetical protein